jgi:Spy/CpxP family protein refolding chaperone
MLGVALVAATASSAVVAQDAPPQIRGGGEQRMLSRMQQQLGLSDGQMTAIRDVQDRHREARNRIFTALQRAQMQLRQLAVNGNDELALQDKTVEVEWLLTQSLQLRVQTLREVAPILTPEQREKFADMGFAGRS